MAQISFQVPTALTIVGATTLSATVSSILRVDAAGVVSTTTLQSNLSLSGGTLSLATALTSVNSLTSVAGQNLVLALGTGGTALTLTNSTLAATFAGAVTFAGDTWQTSGGTQRLYFAADSSRTTYIKGGAADGTGSNAILFRNGADTTLAHFSGAGVFTIAATTASSSVSTGALVVSGGVGVAGNLNVGGTDNYFGANANAYTELRLNAAGGAGQGGYLAIRSAGTLKSALGTRAAILGSGTDQSLLIKSYSDSIYMDGASVSVLGTTASTSTTTGALIVSGGAGIAGAAYIGGKLVANSTAITAASTDAMVLNGTGNNFRITSTNSSTARSFRATVGTGTSVLSDNLQPYTTASQDDTGLPSWQIRFGGGSGADFFDIGRSAAGSTSLTQLFLLGSTGAITLGSASSITAASATDLTLAGGSSGASLVLGQGANGSATFTIPGNGEVTSNKAFVATGALQVGGANRTALDFNAGGGRWFSFGTNTTTAGTYTLFARSSDQSVAYTVLSTVAAGTLTFGTSTPVVVSNTAAATSTTSGALQVAGGGGFAGAVVAGGVLHSTLNAASTGTPSTFGVFVGPTVGGGEGLALGSAGTGSQKIIQAYGAKLAVNPAGNNIELGATGSTVAVLGTTASSTTTTGALTVAGGAGIAGAVYVGSSANVNGTIQVTATTTPSSGSGLEIQGGSAPVLFAYNRTGAAYLPMENYALSFNWRIGATTKMTLSASAGDLALASTTEATTGGAGSLTTAGGIYAAKAIVSASTTAATSTTTGSGIFGGGIGVAGAGWFGGLVRVPAGTLGAPTVAIGAATEGLWLPGSSRIGIQAAGVELTDFTTSRQRIYLTTASSSTTTGALVVDGGVGIAGAINAGNTGVSLTHNITGGDGGTSTPLLQLKEALAGAVIFSVQGTGITNTHHTAKIGQTSQSSTAWGTNGVVLQTGASKTYTDTSSSGTVASAVFSSFAVPTLAASAATTYTVAANVYIAGAPAAGSNVTLTNSYALLSAGDMAIRKGTPVFYLINTTSAQDTEVRYTTTNSDWIVGANPANLLSGSFAFYDATTAGAYVFHLTGGALSAGSAKVSYTTASTSTTTGALVCSGGLGVAGAVFGGGNLTLSSVGSRIAVGTSILERVGVFLAPTFTTTGDVVYGFNVSPTVPNNTDWRGYYSSVAFSTGTTTNSVGYYVANPTGAGSLTNNYGIYIEALTKGATLNYAFYSAGAGVVRIGDTSSSTSTTTGALICSGGLAVATNIVSGQGLGVGVTSTATAAGTTTLTSGSDMVQVFTGTTTQTVTLPAASVFGAGTASLIIIKNRSTGSLTVQRAGTDTIDSSVTVTVAPSAALMLASNGSDTWHIV